MRTAYPVRAIGGVGILLALFSTRVGLPVWLGVVGTATGGAVCIVFLVALLRELLAR